MGPQGSGKGTQGELLAERLGVPLIGAGALLREEIKSGSEIGKEIKAIIDPGNLVPPEMISRMISERIQRDDAKKGVVIDGYPRDKEQLRLMLEKFTPDIAIVLDITNDEAVKRLGGRWMCPDGHIWNENSHKPKVEGKCDHDDKDLFQREDDKEDAIRVRLNIYHDDTRPLIEGLEKEGVDVRHIFAHGSIDDVEKKIEEILK